MENIKVETIQISNTKSVTLEISTDDSTIQIETHASGEHLVRTDYVQYYFCGIFNATSGELLQFLGYSGSTRRLKVDYKDITNFIKQGIKSYDVGALGGNRCKMHCKTMQKAVDIYLGKIPPFIPRVEKEDVVIVTYKHWDRVFGIETTTKKKSMLKKYGTGDIEVVNPTEDLINEIKKHNELAEQTYSIRKNIWKKIDELKKERENGK